MTLGLRACARALGCSHVRLLQLVDEGRVPRNPDNSFDPEAVLDAFRRGTDPSHASKILSLEAFLAQQGTAQNVRPVRPAVREPQSPEIPRLPPVSALVSDTGSLTGVRIERERVKLRLDELELDELERGLMRVDDARKAWSGLVEAVKSRALLIPAKLAPRLAGKDVVEIHIILEAAIRDLLTGLSEYRPNAA